MSCGYPPQMGETELPKQLYNMSFYPLFPEPTCSDPNMMKVGGKCMPVKPYCGKLLNGPLNSAPPCPYGHTYLKGAGKGMAQCVNTLAPPVACEANQQAINGQCVDMRKPRAAGCSSCLGYYGY